MFDPIRWQHRAAELSLRTPLTEHEWRMIIVHFPDISDVEVEASLRVWRECEEKTWLTFWHCLKAAVMCNEGVYA